MYVRIIIRSLIFLGLTAILPFASAGRLDLPFFWAYLALIFVFWIGCISVADPGLLRERMNPGGGGIDRSMRFVMMPIFGAHLVIAGLDVGRFGWSHVPPWLQYVGLAGMAAAYGVSVWAMLVNRFFSPVVRIQAEHGHHVVSSGPYAFVRHPGYLGTLVLMPAAGLALGSWWSILPNAACMVLAVRRLLIEDRYLQENLPGYTEYADRVRYRLLPGVW